MLLLFIVIKSYQKKEKKQGNLAFEIWGSGGMVDTVDSKSIAFKSVRVRIPFPLPY